MPQPLRKLDGLQLGPHALATRKELAAHIGIIASQWTHIDLLFASFLNKIIGGNKDQVISMNLAIQSDRARQSLILAAAEHHLTQGNLTTLNTLFEDARRHVVKRNEVVHGVWGTSTHHPDKLVWCDAKHVMPTVGGMMLATIPVTSDKISARDPLLKWHIDNDSPRYLLYSDSDFKDIQHRLVSFTREVRAFSRQIKGHPAKPSKPEPPCF